MQSLTTLGGAILVAVCTVAAPAAAQSATICGKTWPIPPAGSWAQWQGKDGTTMKMSIIDDEQRNGKPYHRIEVSSSKSGGAMQMVVPGWPPQMDEVDEMVMQRPNQPPMKISGQMLAGMRGMIPTGKASVTDWTKKCGQMKVIGTESVTVPAGTFKTTHMRDDSTASDVWWTPDVPFGMVKFVGKDMEQLLLGTGKDAKTAIVGTPTEMNMPMMGKPNH